LKGQILFRKLKVDAAPPRLYDPLFDIYYWTEKSKPEPTEDNPNPPSDRFDLLLTVLLILDIEFDFYLYSTRKFANNKILLLDQTVLKEAKFPESVAQLNNENRRNIPSLIMFVSSAFDMSISLSDSQKEIDIAREMFEFFKRALFILNKGKGMKELEYKTYTEFFGGLITACLNDQNIIGEPAMDPLIDFNLDLLVKLVEKQNVDEMLL
jgi:hypothetical protein